MNYQAFAALYDTLMTEAPYDEWLNYLKIQLNTDNLENLNILDIGCGTGELLLRLVREGAVVTGVDLSHEMLAIANEKCTKAGAQITLLQQSMTELEGLGEFDVITVFCDSLNYLETEEDVLATFQGMYRHLRPGGIVLFDVHSIYKVTEIFLEQTFAHDDPGISYIWTSFKGEYENSVEHELTFFVRGDDERYERVEELHKQRTYPIEQYEAWLTKAGFEMVRTAADFTEERPTAKSERIFFTARKK